MIKPIGYLCTALKISKFTLVALVVVSSMIFGSWLFYTHFSTRLDLDNNTANIEITSAFVCWLIGHYFFPLEEDWIDVKDWARNYLGAGIIRLAVWLLLLAIAIASGVPIIIWIVALIVLIFLICHILLMLIIVGFCSLIALDVVYPGSVLSVVLYILIYTAMLLMAHVGLRTLPKIISRPK